MEVDRSWVEYHGLINRKTAEDRVSTDTVSVPRVGRYLLRYSGGDYILTFVGLQGRDEVIKPVVVSYARDTRLRKCNPSLTNIKKVVSFLASLKTKLLYPVSDLNFTTLPEHSSSWKRTEVQCHVCDKLYKDQKVDRHSSYAIFNL